MEKFFSGTTKECLNHCVANNPEIIDEMCLFLGTERRVIRSWVLQDAFPIGNRLMALRVYLNIFGYQVEEFEKMPESVKGAFKILSLRVLTEDDLLSQTGYGKRYLQQMLFGYEPLSKVFNENVKYPFR